MSLKNELYAINSGRTLADNMDRAWLIYNGKEHKTKERETAQEFLIYALDLKRVNDLNNQLLALMTDRNQHKSANPDYIPGLSPRHLKLEPTELSLAPTQISHHSPSAKLTSLFRKNEILDINFPNKKHDRRSHVLYFSNQERANMRVHLYQGKFYQQGRLFDTKKYISHRKQGYASFTLNANGELSVFSHHNGADNIHHSSTNNGSPVVGAGELVITNGELRGITTYSGHYQATLFNVYRVLGYFSDKGVNIANANVYTLYNPASYGLHAGVKRIEDLYNLSYSIPANRVFKSIEHELYHSLLQIQSET